MSVSQQSMSAGRAAARGLFACLLLACLAPAVPSSADEKPAAQAEHPLVKAIEHARSSLKTVEEAADYEAEFVKRDIVNNQVFAHTTLLKFRAEPMSAYLKFKVPHAGREVIYVHGRNDGKLLAHETGIASIVGTVALLPTSPRAMSESKYPITEIGMAKLVQGLIDRWEAESKYGECEVQYYPEATHEKLFGQRKHLVIQVIHPRPRKQFEFYESQLWIDRETNLPVRAAHWGFPVRPGEKPPLLEEYTYRNVKLDVGLKDVDFDVNNPNYGF
jgi:hypothetical protein